MKTLQINEIFGSINGEVCNRHQGSLCTFVRLQGCNCHCSWCDTVKAQEKKGGKSLSVKEVVDKINGYGNVNVTITGGEPLLQKEVLEELVSVISKDHLVSIETNGSILIPYYPPWEQVNWVIDYKLPSSGENKKMCSDVFRFLKTKDLVKFVISSRSDFQFAVKKMKQINTEKGIFQYPIFAFSPCLEAMSALQLYRLMSKSVYLKTQGAVLSLQLHKMIGIS